MFFNGKRPQTVVRTVSVQVKKPARADDAASKPGKTQSRSGTPSKSATTPKPAKKKNNASLKAPTSSSSSSRPKASPRISAEPRAASSSSSLKRKQAHQSTVVFDTDSSDESDDDNDNDDLINNKRFKQDSKSPVSPGFDDTRTIFAFGEQEAEAEEEEDDDDDDEDSSASIKTSEQLTSGSYAKKYRSIDSQGVSGDSDGSDSPRHVVKLRYPNSRKGGSITEEPFELVVPHDSTDYKPLSDLTDTITQLLTSYLPSTLSAPLLDDNNGLPRRLKRAIEARSPERIAAAVAEFNTTFGALLDDGTVQAHLRKSVHALDTDLVDHIITQVYQRIVSPQIHLVREYENGTSNVYGEILPPFAHRIFRETSLRSPHVFVDLGSGVGNVVLQAALETGCESWGIEMMRNPAALAAQQLREFRARCAMYGIRPGKVTLIQGNFLEDPDIRRALQRADAVLVNNKAFVPQLNDSILNLMLDLREGCRVVSLKTFVPVDWRIKQRSAHDVRNLFAVQQRWYPSQGSVSWTDTEGDYYLATKDLSKYRAWVKANSGK